MKSCGVDILGMKVVILCGGTGTRMKEETEFKPKPLVLVGGKPILWHIMKIYAHHGFNDFILALGYKGDMIKQYFLNWRNLMDDFTLDTKSNELVFHNNNKCDDFKITFAETGQESLTGERVRRLKKYIDGDDFLVTYGDGVGDGDLDLGVGAIRRHEPDLLDDPLRAFDVDHLFRRPEAGLFDVPDFLGLGQAPE